MALPSEQYATYHSILCRLSQLGYANWYFLGLWQEGLDSLGIKRAYDPLCDPLGSFFSPHALDHSNQSRVDARIAYFDPIFGAGGTPRDNIDVIVNTMVTKLIMSNDTADGTVIVTGVEVSRSPRKPDFFFFGNL